MAYLVKPVNGEERRMEMVTIQDALKNGLIAENWLVKDERQDFWYSIGKLVGKTKSEAILLTCPQCRTPIHARRIDIGLPAACPNCYYTVTVPDPDAFARNMRDLQLLLDARRLAILGALALTAGIAVTVGTFLFRDEATGSYILFWGPIVFGLGTFLGTFPRYLELKRKLGPLIVHAEAAKQHAPNRYTDPDDQP